jgi:hypothetical protein
MAMKMITELCGDDAQNGQRSFGNVDRRIGLWDAMRKLLQ